MRASASRAGRSNFPRRARGAAWLAALAALAASTGCGDDTAASSAAGGGGAASASSASASTSSTSSAGGGGMGGTSTSTSTSTSSGGVAHEDPWSTCDACLSELCAAEEAACDAECQAVDACIQTFCKGLSANDTTGVEEGKCQANCQADHPTGKATHLALVNCATTVADDATCFPPCTPFPQDYDACRDVMLAADCADEQAACEADLNCTNFKDCVRFCSDAAECFACDDEPAKLAGRQLYEAVEACIATECVNEGWVP